MHLVSQATQQHVANVTVSQRCQFDTGSVGVTASRLWSHFAIVKPVPDDALA